MTKTMGMVRVCCSSAAVVGVVLERMRSGCDATSSLAILCIASASSGIAQRWSIWKVVTFRPAQRPKFFANRRGPSLRFRIALGAPNEHADLTYPLCLLRARNQRETSCAAE